MIGENVKAGQVAYSDEYTGGKHVEVELAGQAGGITEDVVQVLAHLARCLAQDASPRAFVEPFVVEGPVLAHEQEARALQRWALISDHLLARPLAAGVHFQLRQGDVYLLCSVKRLPKFSLAEEVVDPKSNRFVLRLNSETSV